MVQFTGDFGAAPAGDLKQGETLHAAGYWSRDQTADQYTNTVDVDATLGVGAKSNFLTAVNGYVENDETTLTTPWIAALYANGRFRGRCKYHECGRSVCTTPKSLRHAGIKYVRCLDRR